MATPDYRKAIKKAQQVLEENYILVPPIRIVDLSNNYGLQVFTDDEMEVSGFIDFSKSKAVVNENDHPKRRRFTLAHELGHFLLHKGLKKKFLERHNPLGSEKPYYEKEANAFAAHLLVPLSFLKKEKHLSVDELSDLFKDSVELEKEVREKKVSSVEKVVKDYQEPIVEEDKRVALGLQGSQSRYLCKKYARQEFNAWLKNIILVIGGLVGVPASIWFTIQIIEYFKKLGAQ